MREYDAGFIAGFVLALVTFAAGFCLGALLSTDNLLVLMGVVFGGWLGALWHSLHVETKLEEKCGGGA